FTPNNPVDPRHGSTPGVEAAATLPVPGVGPTGTTERTPGRGIMRYLMNDPAAFAEESAEGFAAAHPPLVRLAPAAAARRSATPHGQVAVVIGGGSGHYPAFAGLIGPGLAHAAAMGNIFASPSSRQVFSAAQAVATPAGVLLSYGNYAGDALNFDLAQ